MVIDWFRVIAEIERAGIPDAEQAKRIGVPRSTLRGWKGGSEPLYKHGEALLTLYSEVLQCPNGGTPPKT